MYWCTIWGKLITLWLFSGDSRPCWELFERHVFTLVFTTSARSSVNARRLLHSTRLSLPLKNNHPRFRFWGRFRFGAPENFQNTLAFSCMLFTQIAQQRSLMESLNSVHYPPLHFRLAQIDQKKQPIPAKWDRVVSELHLSTARWCFSSLQDLLRFASKDLVFITQLLAFVCASRIRGCSSCICCVRKCVYFVGRILQISQEHHLNEICEQRFWSRLLTGSGCTTNARIELCENSTSGELIYGPIFFHLSNLPKHLKSQLQQACPKVFLWA